MPHSKPLFTHSTSSMNGHCQAHMSYTFIHKEENRRGGARLEKKGKNLPCRMGNPGDIFFCVALSLWGQMPAGLPPHCLSLCVPLSFAHSN